MAAHKRGRKEHNKIRCDTDQHQSFSAWERLFIDFFPRLLLMAQFNSSSVQFFSVQCRWCEWAEKDREGEPQGGEEERSLVRMKLRESPFVQKSSFQYLAKLPVITCFGVSPFCWASRTEQLLRKIFYLSPRPIINKYIWSRSKLGQSGLLGGTLFSIPYHLEMLNK